MSTGIIATVHIAGVHNWKNPPEAAAFGKLLSNYHRHLFKVSVNISDLQGREIEFFELQEVIRNIFRSSFKEAKPGVLFFEDASCERLAKLACHEIHKHYDLAGPVMTTVWEDDENAGWCSMQRTEYLEDK